MRAQLEAIWLDKKCRSPLTPVIWSAVEVNDYSNREIAGLYSTPAKYMEDVTNVKDR